MAVSTSAKGAIFEANLPDAADAAGKVPPDPALVRGQLERILGSSEFQGSERIRRFLRYVVEETLAGRDARIKAFTVAVAAFDRDENFDPQTDPIVRIEAGRLRRNLERYYLVAGMRDDVRIAIPKGSYVPRFSWNRGGMAGSPGDADAGPPAEAPAVSPLRRLAAPPPGVLLAILAAVLVAGVGFAVLKSSVTNVSPETAEAIADGQASPSQPSIAVLPFASTGMPPAEAAFSAGMTDEVVRELSQHSGVLVLGPRSLQRFGSSPDITTMGRETGTEFVLSGDVQHEGTLIRVAVQLSETKTGTVIWAETYSRTLDVKGIFDLQAEIGREIVRKIAQPQGAIALYDWKRTRGMAPETWEAYDCVIQAEELQRRGELVPNSAEVRACLRRATVREPGYADPWVMLALLEIDTLRYTPRTQISPESLDTAYAAALQGIDLAPDSGRAHMALMLALFFRGDVERALAIGNVAMRLSPQDPDVIGEVGLRHVVAGSPDIGLELLRRAADLYVDPPHGLCMALSLGYLRNGRFAEASDVIAEEVPNRNFIYLSVAAAAHGMARKLTAARRAADELLQLNPDFGAWAHRELAQRFVAPDLAATLMQGWKAAGLTIDPPAVKDLDSALIQ